MALGFYHEIAFDRTDWVGVYATDCLCFLPLPERPDGGTSIERMGLLPMPRLQTKEYETLKIGPQPLKQKAGWVAGDLYYLCLVWQL